MIRTFLFSLAFLSLALNAEEIRVEYSSFYSHVRKLDNEGLNALQFSFGFKHVAKNELCAIKNAHIHTQKQTIPIDINNENRFTLPSEKALKLAKAEVVVDLAEKANRCDMSVQLETKPSFLKTQYSGDDLNLIFQQYQNFFDEMGGFLSFMMPSATGIAFVFEQPIDLEGKGLEQEGDRVLISADWLASNKGVEWKVSPVRITAITSK